MYLTDHVRVDGKSKSARMSTGPHNPLYSVEPGDGTHYEVAPRGNIIIACVGEMDDDGRSSKIMLHTDSGHVSVMGTPSEYTKDVLVYFAKLAAGWDVPEPGVLADRRQAYLDDAKARRSGQDFSSEPEEG